MGEEGPKQTFINSTVTSKMDSTVTLPRPSHSGVLIESQKESKNAICLLMEDNSPDV